jgi:hypothetical protein
MVPVGPFAAGDPQQPGYPYGQGEWRHTHLGSQRQPQADAHPGAGAHAAAAHHLYGAEHRQHNEERQQRVHGVEVGELNVQDGEGHEHGCQEAYTPVKETLAEHKDQEYDASVKDCRDPPAKR